MFGVEGLMKKDFLSILDLSRDQAQNLLKRAAWMKENDFRSNILEGKTIVLLFEKASTRTKVSFEVSINHLGGHHVFMTPADSQLGRSEPLKDTARVLSRYVQGLVVRTYGQKNLEELARHGTIPVINALSDEYHPCQVMSDLLTIHELTPDFEMLKIAWIGDGNNMAHSWINAAARFPFKLHLAVPRGFEPGRDILKRAVDLGADIKITHEPREAVHEAHYINTDVWASMGQEEEQKTRSQAFAGFCVDEELLKEAPEEARILHCLPAHRGQEITDAVIEGSSSLVWDQAENRLHMQKAILEWIFKQVQAQ